MKQSFFKKAFLVIFLAFFIFTNSASSLLAAENQDYYRTNKENSNAVETTNIITKIGSTTIINKSDKDYFVPNRTISEIDSFANKAPNYVTVSVCGNNNCDEGEDIYSCANDCGQSGKTGYCGDGICSQATVIYSSTTPLAYIPGAVCQKKKGWLAIVAGVVVGGVVTVATGGLGIGLGAGMAAGIITGVLVPSTTVNCGQDTPIYSVSVKKGEVYEIDSQYVNQSECKADCAPPSGSGCGSCGYDVNGNLCPNYCSNRGYNMINCKYYSASTVTPNSNGTESFVKKDYFKKYLTATEALAAQDLTTSSLQDGYYYYDSSYYGCDFGTSGSSYYCPAGTYCPYTGGMKTGTTATSYVNATWLNARGLTMNDLQPKTCPSGFFCPEGSFYTRPCPINTFSTGGAEKCTACLSGTGTGNNSAVTSESYCQPVFKARDGVCNITDSVKETAVNSSFDCPDSSHMSMFKGDGRCSGLETMANTPEDCKCGNGVCDNSETYLSCLPDCGCMDGVCGSVIYGSNWTKTVFPEGNTCNSYGTIIPNKSICKYLNNGDVCGNDICESGEGYRYIQDIDGVYKNKIVCPLDCHCGDGSCNSSQGENWNWSTNSGTCQLDCKCGNGTCDSNESSYSCMTDCHCGNYSCEESYGENAYNCSSDCRCGDNICSAGETSCTADCGAGDGTCGDGVCAYMKTSFGKRTKETMANCPEDCGPLLLE